MNLIELQVLRERLLTELDNCNAADALEAYKLAHLTRKGTIASLFEDLRNVPKEEKPQFGKQLNEFRQLVESRFAEKEAEFGGTARKREERGIDLSMPGRPVTVTEAGHEHPLMRTFNEMVSIFERMGFAVELGPEVEDDEHNFTKLNFPADHPARDMQDTFFVAPSPQWKMGDKEEHLVLRTHTSPVQVRVLETQKPPIRAIMPGRVYRNEAISARSGIAFFQIEGLVVDKGVTMADLKGVLLSFAKQYFGSDVKIRLRPSFFPFTEPSAEVDVSCYICGGKGCRICKYSGWLEIAGSGMVHPNELRACGLDPEIYTGYAFGFGIDRTAMMRYGVTDIRDFSENDYRFLKQF